MTHIEHFWKVVADHQKIYKIELELISPNILETNRAARDALEALEAVFNQDKVKTVLESESGSLKVPPTPTANYLEYIGEGEGSWKIVTEGSRGGKKSHTSKEKSETIDLPVPEVGASEPSLFDGSKAIDTNDRDLSDSRRVAEAFTWAAKRLRKG